VIDALERAIFNKPLNTSINICSGVPTKIETLAQHILKIMNLDDVGIVFSQDTQGKPSILYGSYEKAHRMLNWKPKTNLYGGLKKTIEFMLREYSHIGS
jgi:nucleoside-diphosphate-sugar epimerase